MPQLTSPPGTGSPTRLSYTGLSSSADFLMGSGHALAALGAAGIVEGSGVAAGRVGASLALAT
jgi:hypothetical protein